MHLQGRVDSIVFFLILRLWEEVLDVLPSKLFSNSLLLHNALLSVYVPMAQSFPCPHVFQNWHYGFVFINGRNLGRYWDIGPQRTLYLPGPWLHPEDNEVSYPTLPQSVINC